MKRCLFYVLGAPVSGGAVFDRRPAEPGCQAKEGASGPACRGKRRAEDPIARHGRGVVGLCLGRKIQPDLLSGRSAAKGRFGRHRPQGAGRDGDASPEREHLERRQLCRRLLAEERHRRRARNRRQEIRYVHQRRQRLGSHRRPRPDDRIGAGRGTDRDRQGHSQQRQGDDRCLFPLGFHQGAGADRRGVRDQPSRNRRRHASAPRGAKGLAANGLGAGKSRGAEQEAVCAQDLQELHRKASKQTSTKKSAQAKD